CAVPFVWGSGAAAERGPGATGGVGARARPSPVVGVDQACEDPGGPIQGGQILRGQGVEQSSDPDGQLLPPGGELGRALRRGADQGGAGVGGIGGALDEALLLEAL